MDPFNERVAVVTGAASGIGRALAQALAARGAHLVLADLDAEGLEREAKNLEAQGARVRTVPTDVRQSDSVENLARRCDELGAVHLLFNNAGIVRGGEVAQMPLEEWEEVLAVNFWGVLNGVRAFVPRMLAHGEGGHIVNTASMAGLVGMPFMGAYAVSKFAVVGLSESLQRELAERGIGVHVLAPMMVDTAMTRAGVEAGEASKLVGGLIGADEVALRTLRGIERGDLYILTHDAQQEILQRKAHRLESLFDPSRWPLDRND